MPDSHHRALLRRFQLPSDPCHHVPRPTRHPRRLQHAHPIHRYILPRYLERPPVAAHSHRPPFSSGSQIGVKFGAPVDSLLPRHCGTCAGSTSASKTRSAGAAICTSLSTAPASGVTLDVAISPFYVLFLFFRPDFSFACSRSTNAFRLFRFACQKLR
jgi:hypothetical protein